nr:MAG TPA: hypothetical protein [Caudoviricetes sp.]
MIECEECGRYKHVDDIEECPKCGMELCESCYQEHVKRCLNPEVYEDDDYQN